MFMLFLPLVIGLKDILKGLNHLDYSAYLYYQKMNLYCYNLEVHLHLVLLYIFCCFLKFVIAL